MHFSSIIKSNRNTQHLKLSIKIPLNEPSKQLRRKQLLFVKMLHISKTTLGYLLGLISFLIGMRRLIQIQAISRQINILQSKPSIYLTMQTSNLDKQQHLSRLENKSTQLCQFMANQDTSQHDPTNSTRPTGYTFHKTIAYH